MDINSFYQLARAELNERNKALPTVLDYGPVNVSTEPGWLLQMFHRLETALKPVQSASQRNAAQDCAPDCPPTLTQNHAHR